jgi:two-component system cell cycle response regulator DivK
MSESQPTARPGAGRGHSRVASIKPLILVVDDDWATRRALAQLLGDELDAEVAEAEDGEDARYALMEATPDVALVDARMPWPDGFELMRRMQLDPITAAIPVVGISALPVAQRMLAAGCVAFVPKPFEAEDLIAAVRSALAGR